jgi:hypothetical protein
VSEDEPQENQALPVGILHELKSKNFGAKRTAAADHIKLTT